MFKGLFTLLLLVAHYGCADHPGGSQGQPSLYDPASFRADITRLIEVGRYADTVALGRTVDVDRQVVPDDSGYLAVGWITTEVFYDSDRDWYIPGTQGAIEEAEWQFTAHEFAVRYNPQRRAELSKQP